MHGRDCSRLARWWRGRRSCAHDQNLRTPRTSGGYSSLRWRRLPLCLAPRTPGRRALRGRTAEQAAGPLVDGGGPRSYRASGHAPVQNRRKAAGDAVRVLGLFAVRRERCRRAVRLVEAYQHAGPKPADGAASASASAASSPPSSAVAGAATASTARSAASAASSGAGTRSARPTRPTWCAGVANGGSTTATRSSPRARSRWAPSGSCARRGRTRACSEIDMTRDIFLRACETGDPIRESSGPVSRSTATATRSARPASRSGCCARTAPGFSAAQERHADPRRQRRPGRRGHHPGRDRDQATPR